MSRRRCQVQVDETDEGDDEIGEEVTTAPRRWEGPGAGVESASDDACPHEKATRSIARRDRRISFVRVGEHRRGDAGGTGEPFGRRPSEVGAARNDIDFFPQALTDIVDVDAAGAGLHAKGERVAQPMGPAGARQVALRGAVRVVTRDAAVVVEPQQLAQR